MFRAMLIGATAFLTCLVLLTTTANADQDGIVRYVSTLSEFHSAKNAANPGDTILIAPGTYVSQNNKIKMDRAGALGNPIVIRPEIPGTVTFEFFPNQHTFEFMEVRAPHYLIQGLTVRANCTDQDENTFLAGYHIRNDQQFCEHAFHITGFASDVTIKDNVMLEFNGAIHAHGNDSTGATPDRVRILGNQMISMRPRNIYGFEANPVRIRGGKNHVVSRNAIINNVKLTGNRLSYGVAMLGNVSDSVIGQNLIVCNRDFTSDQIANTRHIGIRVGQDPEGSAGQIMDGIRVQNNVVLSCNQESLELQKTFQAQVIHNSFLGERGVVLAGENLNVLLANNLIKGPLRSRPHSVVFRTHNLVDLDDSDLAQMFESQDTGDFTPLSTNTDPNLQFVQMGIPTPSVQKDICGKQRNAASVDIGAIENGPSSCASDLFGHFGQ